jgi:DNA-binding CsgD family transcriptional regulator
MQQLASTINASEAKASEDSDYIEVLHDRIGHLEYVLDEHGLLDEDGEPIDTVEADAGAQDEGHKTNDDAGAQVQVERSPAPADVSDRDQTIIRMVEAGESYRGIARKLGISDGTVRNVIKRHQHQAEAA